MTTPNRPLPSLVTDAQRDAVTQALSAHFANDRMSIEALDARMAMVYEATSLAELDRALEGLEVAPRAELAPAPVGLTVSEELVPPRSVCMAFMGGFETKGSWVLPRQLWVFTAMGGASIDLREARFGAGVSEIHIGCALGGVELIVPPGVRLEVLGSGILGGFDAGSRDKSTTDPSAPVIRVSGVAILGGVDIQVKGPSKKMLQRFEEALRRVGIGRSP